MASKSVRFKMGGSTRRTRDFLSRAEKFDLAKFLDSLGRQGVEALKSATPRKTGLTADSWSYTIEQTKDKTTISWTNSNRTPGGPPVAILLQYGHMTGTGGYVVGQDYINPAIKPIFDKIAADMWKGLTSR